MNSGRAIRRERGSPTHQDPVAVRQAREEAGLQQLQLAALLGISAQLMADIESGRRNADPARLRLIAKHTNAEVSDLRRDKTQRQPSLNATSACA